MTTSAAPITGVEKRRATEGLSPALWTGVFAGPAIWPAGSYLLRQDYPVPVVYLLLDGRVKLTHSDAEGQESLLELKHRSAVLGSALVLAGERSSHNFVTMTSCALRWCSADAFVQALRENQARTADVQRVHSLEIVSLTARLAKIAVKSSERRLIQFLDEYGDSSKAFRHVEIASFIRVTPEHLSRMLKKMARTA